MAGIPPLPPSTTHPVIASVHHSLTNIVSCHVSFARSLVRAAGTDVDVEQYEHKCHAALNDKIDETWQDDASDENIRKIEMDVYDMCRAEARSLYAGELLEDLLALSEKMSKSDPAAMDDDTGYDISSNSSKNEVLEYISSFFTFNRWWSNYHPSWLKGDFIASITVWFMLIPQGMAYSQLAGLPPIFGLYNTLIPLVVYPFFGTSRELVLGPTAIVSLFTGQILGHYVTVGTPEYVPMAHALAFVCGLVVTLVGMLKLGFVLESLLSRPLLHGFVNGAALVISLSQTKHLFGFVKFPSTNDLVSLLINIFSRLDGINWWTFLFGITCLVLMWVLKKIWKHLPASFIVMLLATFVSWIANLEEVAGILVVGDVPQGLPLPTLLTAFTPANFVKLLGAAAEIALLIAIESISICKTLSGRHKPPYATGADQEIFAAGIANMLTSVLQGFPVAGSFSRSAVNFVAGSHTPFSGWLTSCLVILSLVVLTPLFKLIPNVALGTVVIYAALKLIDFSEIKLLWRLNKIEFAQTMICFLVTLFFGAEIGILTAIGMSIAAVVYRAARPRLIQLGRLKGTSIYRDISSYPEAIHTGSMIVVKHDTPLLYTNVAHFTETLEDLVDERWPVIENGNGACCRSRTDVEMTEQPKTVNTVVIDGSNITSIDMTAIHQTKTLLEAFRKRDIQILWVQASATVRNVMNLCEFDKVMGIDAFFPSVHMAVVWASDGNVIEGLKEAADVVTDKSHEIDVEESEVE